MARIATNIVLFVIIAVTLGAVSYPRSNAKVFTDEEKLAGIENINRESGLHQEDWTAEDVDRCRPVIKAMLKGQHRIDLEYVQSQPGGQMDRCFDIHSGYLTPKDYKDMQIRTSSRIKGIGVEIIQSCREWPQLVVRCTVSAFSVFDGPAQTAGFQKGDILKEMTEKGKTVVFRNASHAAEHIRGPVDTTISIVIERDGVERVLPVTRGDVTIPSVYWAMHEGVCHITITHSADTTGDEWDAANRACDSDRVIVDLRNNPGGALGGAVEVLFSLSKELDRTILRFATKDSETPYTVRNPLNECANLRPNKRCATFHDPESGSAKHPGEFAKRHIVILQNGGSASASEIFAGACQDWDRRGLRAEHGEGRCVIMGTSSHGKVHGQTVYPFNHPEKNGAWRVTTFRFLPGEREATPPGVGIEPDLPVEDNLFDRGDGPDTDAMLRAALNWHHEEAALLAETARTTPQG